MQNLREHAANALNMLRDGDIDVATAIATSKLCDTVISTVKSEMEYSAMTEEKPDIPFLRYEKDVFFIEDKRTTKGLPKL